MSDGISPVSMGPSRCTVCFQPSVEFPHDFKAVLSDFIQIFNKFQHCTRRCGTNSIDCSEATDLLLCRTCWIYFMQIHKLHGQLSVKKETCEDKSKLLSLKIRQGQRSLENSGNNLIIGEDDAQTLAPGSNLLEVGGQAEDANCAIVGRRYCNQSETESLDLSANEDTSSFESLTEEELSDELESEEESDSEPQAVKHEAQLVAAYENKWLPNNFTIPKSSSVVKRRSEVDFIYKGRYPFQGTGTGFKCGLCPTVCTFHKKSQIWENINNHIRKLHMRNRNISDNVARRRSCNTSKTESLDLSATADSTSSESSRVAEQLEHYDERDSESQPFKNNDELATAYENKWLPKNLTIPGPSPVVKRLSEVDFTYMGKYPFAAVDGGFKCGLCPATCGFHKWKSRIFHNILYHMRTWHKDNRRKSGRKFRQMLIEIAPNRFQYGKQVIEWIDGNYRCETCGEIQAPRPRGPKAAGILEHINRKHENPSRTHVCEYCGIVYKSLQCLRGHKLTKHETPSSTFPCSDCDKTFVSHSRLLQHHKTVHQGIYKGKKFVCEICGKECGQKLALENHVAFVHKGQKIECKDCGKMFASQSALLTHRNSHTGRKYTCNICGMEFTQHYSVTRHKKTAHPE